MSEMSELEDSNHRVFFQNAEGNINMGVFFNDPDVELGEIYWYNAMAKEIAETLEKDEELIAVDEELGTHSCYVELHRLDKKQFIIQFIISFTAIQLDQMVEIT